MKLTVSKELDFSDGSGYEPEELKITFCCI